ncbi:MAG: hypothetical protein ACRDVE_08460, partial [Actinocrinis sp.]
MTETQHDHDAQNPQPQWTAPRAQDQATVQAHEGEYAWRNSGQPQPQAAPVPAHHAAGQTSRPSSPWGAPAAQAGGPASGAEPTAPLNPG